jgi:hypothetical protein
LIEIIQNPEVSNMIPEIEQYLDSKEKIKQETADCDTKVNELNNEYKKVNQKYYEIIRNMCEQRDDKLNKIHEKRDNIKTKCNQRIEELNIPIKNVEHIIELLTTNPIRKRVRENELSYRVRYNNTPKPLLFYHEYIDTEANALRACIIETDKPKNKYSLCIVGESKYKNENDYGVQIDCRKNSIVTLPTSFEIKSDETVEKLIEFYKRKMLKTKSKKHQVQKLDKLIELNEKYEQEAQMYKSKYTLSDFDPILEYRCEVCENYTVRKNQSSKPDMENPTCPYCNNPLKKV